MNAIRLLAQERDVKWDVVTCVNRRNYPRLEQLKDALYEAGVRRWRLFTIFPVGRAARYPEFQLDDRDFKGLMDFIRRTRREGKLRVSYGCEGFLGSYEGEVRDGFYTCNAGISVASVLADGSISACPSIRADYHQGNIYQDDFMDVWQHRFQPFRDRRWMKKVCVPTVPFPLLRGQRYAPARRRRSPPLLPPATVEGGLRAVTSIPLKTYDLLMRNIASFASEGRMFFVSFEPGVYFLFRLFLYFGRLVRLTVRLSFAEVDGCFLSCCILIKFGCPLKYLRYASGPRANQTVSCTQVVQVAEISCGICKTVPRTQVA